MNQERSLIFFAPKRNQEIRILGIKEDNKERAIKISQEQLKENLKEKPMRVLYNGIEAKLMLIDTRIVIQYDTFQKRIMDDNSKGILFFIP